MPRLLFSSQSRLLYSFLSDLPLCLSVLSLHLLHLPLLYTSSRCLSIAASAVPASSIPTLPLSTFSTSVFSPYRPLFRHSTFTSVSALLLSPHALCLGSYLFRLSLPPPLPLSVAASSVPALAQSLYSLHLSPRSTSDRALPHYPLYLSPRSTPVPALPLSLHYLSTLPPFRLLSCSSSTYNTIAQPHVVIIIVIVIVRVKSLRFAVKVTVTLTGTATVVVL